MIGSFQTKNILMKHRWCFTMNLMYALCLIAILSVREYFNAFKLSPLVFPSTMHSLPCQPSRDLPSAPIACVCWPRFSWESLKLRRPESRSFIAPCPNYMFVQNAEMVCKQTFFLHRAQGTHCSSLPLSLSLLSKLNKCIKCAPASTTEND